MKDRVIAILLCFFVGGFGIHKFYLGKNTEGIIYLIFSWTFIPSIFSFFEFLGLCFMSQREFNARFNYDYPGGSIDQGSSYPLMTQQRSAQDSTAALYDLKKLYDDQIITAEEYEMKRRKILEGI
jgi:TM2 domain-containing membrane protein YozV